jgi:5-methylcytosine-specific restriction endonuclease McrA
MAKKKKPIKLTKAKIKKMARTAKRKQLVQWSKDVRERDGYKCAVCGKTEYLNAHHLIPKERFPQHQFDVKNGITLCPSCHKYGSYSFHRHPLWSVDWLKNNRPEQYDYVMQKTQEDILALQNAINTTVEPNSTSAS